MKDKIVLITGGTSGIGFAMAEFFGKNGSRIAFTGRIQTRNIETEKKLEALGVESFGIQADASSETDQRKAVVQTINRYGRLDVLINNAGISMRALFLDLDLAVFHKVMEINFYGTVYITQAALPYLIRSKGTIVGISSVAGFKGLPCRTAYSASKFAMQGFLESLQSELFRKDVNVLMAFPGFTSTRIRENALIKDGSAQGVTPRSEEKMMQPEEVARQVYNAVVRKKKQIVMTTEGKLSFWLNKFFPSFVSWKVYQKMASEPGSGLEL
jgi:dehydrogenase/reductase SDR family member 7B